MRAQANASAADPVAAQIREIGALIQKNNGAEAEAAGLALLKAYPNRHDVHNIMGVVYVHLNKRSKAVPHFEAAVKAQPNNAVYLNNLGRLYLDLDLIELALPPLERALAINPKLAETLWAIGEYYRDSGKAETGLPYLQRALKIDPSNHAILSALAESLEAIGKLDEAKAVFESLLQFPQSKPICVFRLSQIGKPTIDSPLFAEAQALIHSYQLGRSNLSRVHSALAHLYENSGDLSRAFEHFQLANIATQTTFEIAKYRNWVDQTIATFAPEFLASRRHLGNPSEVPVFVVGMPRSGTTMTELIIASHPQAGGAGELARMRRFCEKVGYNRVGGNFAEAFDALGSKQIADLAENYLGLLRFHAPNAVRVVDKMPHNFELLGFIALLFPNARIIHCRRNPADTCWSCYQNRLSARHGYSKNLRDLGLYYREYLRLMDHWRKVLPSQIYESGYESLTTDPETNVRKIISFVGLPWDSACLDFHKSGATVSTISRQQVRQPVYTSSVERWRRYEQELIPLTHALGDALKKGPAVSVGP